MRKSVISSLLLQRQQLASRAGPSYCGGSGRLLGLPRFTGRHNLARFKVANEARPVIADCSAEEGVGRALTLLAPLPQRTDRLVNFGGGLCLAHPFVVERNATHAHFLRRPIAAFGGLNA